MCFCVLGWLAKPIAAKRHGFITQAVFPPSQRLIINAEVVRLLKQNRYDQVAKTLTFSEAEAASYQRGSAYVADGGPNRQEEVRRSCLNNIQLAYSLVTILPRGVRC